MASTRSNTPWMDLFLNLSQVLMLLTKQDTCLDLWNSLNKHFGSQSRAKLMKMKLQLQSTKKEGLTVIEYYIKLKKILDGLYMARQPVSNDNFIMHLLQGLSSEYDAVITNVNSQLLLLEIEEVLALLLSQQMCIISSSTPPLSPSAHLVNRPLRRQKSIDFSLNHAANQFNSHQIGQNWGRGRERGRQLGNSHPYC